jgi:Fe2+ or Zn2+ uptake regulation protein
VSLATVYRTLALFKELGLINEHRLGEDHSHFETAPENPHYHFTCLNCRRVIEFKAPQIAETILPMLQDKGLQIAEVHLIISGFCADCQHS